MQHMQRPTCTNVRIRSTQDAHKIFYAVQQGILQMVTRRLDADERLALRSGCIYAWEERGPHTEITGLGIERFTEGRRWSPSRVRDEFLFYYEKYTPSTDGNQRSSDIKVPPRDWDPLVKQTYSVFVDTDKGRRKWHLTAYFTQATVDQLGTVDDIDGVGNLDVPDGIFKSTRVNKNRKNDDHPTRAGESPLAAPSAVTRTYAPFPNTYMSNHLNEPGTPPGSQPLQMYQPYPSSSYSAGHYPSTTPEYSPASALPHRAALPPISGGSYSSPESPARHLPPTSQYNDYGRPSALSDRPWPSPNIAPRTADTSHYYSNSGVPPSYSSAGSYRSSAPHIPSHSSPAADMYTTDSSRASGDCSPSPQTWPPEVVNRPVTEMNRAEVQTPYASRPYEGPYAFSTSPDSDPSPHQAQPLRARSPRGSPQTTSLSGFAPPSVPPIVLSDASAIGASYEPPSPTGSMDSDDRRGSVGPCRRVDLAPLHALQRNHPYRRDPLDDRTLRLLGPRSS